MKIFLIDFLEETKNHVIYYLLKTELIIIIYKLDYTLKDREKDYLLGDIHSQMIINMK